MFGFLLCSASLWAQPTSGEKPSRADTARNTEGERKHHVFDEYGVEQMPQFPGGFGAQRKFIQSHIIYPEDAEKKKIEGRVICTFLIDEYGRVSNVNVKRSLYPSLDEEAVRVIKSMPRWIPGKNLDGTPSRVLFSLPIEFKL